MRSVNIQDIAREAGVGKATVSRVINGKGYVSRETAAKVKAVMERHHYQPSALARSLSRRESDAIGLIIPEANNPFFSALLTGVSEVMDKCGYTLILRTSGNRVDRDRDRDRKLAAERAVDAIRARFGNRSLETGLVFDDPRRRKS